MITRVLLLPAILAALFGTAGCSSHVVTSNEDESEPARAPRTKTGPSEEARQPTPQELAEAEKAYKDLGGGYTRDSDHDGRPVHRFFPPKPLAAEVLAKLPDLPFGYTFVLSIDSNTPPGTLKALAHLRDLRHVSVSQGRGSGRGGNITPRIAELAAIPNLERLVLDSEYELLTDGLAKELVAFPSLRILAGTGSITDSGLEKLSHHPKLESLALLGCPDVTDGGLAHLAKMPNLIGLSLYGPKLTAAGFAHFTKEPRLVRLAIGGNGMQEDILAELEKVRTLEKLNLNLFHIQEGGLTEQGVAHIVRLPRLRDLVLPTGRITDAGPTGRITDAGLKVLASAPALEQLSLFVSVKVTDAGVEELARVTTLKSLRMFGAEQLTDESLMILAALPELVSLDIAVTKHLTEKGMRGFVARRGDKLVRLVIQGMPVSDEFVADLATKTPNLQFLNIGQCESITDKSVPALSKLTKLRRLDVRETSITPDGTETLSQRLPDCRVDGPTGGNGDIVLFALAPYRRSVQSVGSDRGLRRRPTSGLHAA